MVVPPVIIQVMDDSTILALKPVTTGDPPWLPGPAPGRWSSSVSPPVPPARLLDLALLARWDPGSLWEPGIFWETDLQIAKYFWRLMSRRCSWFFPDQHEYPCPIFLMIQWSLIWLGGWLPPIFDHSWSHLPSSTRGVHWASAASWTAPVGELALSGKWVEKWKLNWFRKYYNSFPS